MNLIEAIKSGKPIRRKMPDPAMRNLNEWATVSATSWVELPVSDLLADDWEIQEPTVTITRSQFWGAVNHSTSAQLGREIYLSYADIERLARELGLEP